MKNHSHNSLILHNAKVVLPEHIIDGGGVEIYSGHILNVLDSPEKPPASASAVDLNGATLFPGFIDIHIHGAVGIDVNSADAEGLLRVSEFLASKGVTAWLPTLVPGRRQQYKRAVAAIDEAMERQQGNAINHGARVLGVHYEGPFVNSEQCGALHREHFRTFKSAKDLHSLPMVSHTDAVHMTTVAPEIDGGIDLIRELRALDWIVSIGHTRATPDVLDKAKEAGAHHMTHFMNAMSPLHHRAPGPVGWGLLNDEIGLDVIADGIHLDPLMLKVLLRTVTPERLSLISDAIAASGEGDGEYEIWGEKISVENGRTRNTQGNIAGSVITMLDAVKTMLSLGASESDVARMASSNLARALAIDNECGAIDDLKRADLVALDSRGQVQLTLIGGEMATTVLS